MIVKQLALKIAKSTRASTAKSIRIMDCGYRNVLNIIDYPLEFDADIALAFARMRSMVASGRAAGSASMSGSAGDLRPMMCLVINQYWVK